MRFRTTSPTPPQFDARLQRRLLGYVALTAGVMLVFQFFAAKPQTTAPVGTIESPISQSGKVRDRSQRPLAADEFLSEPPAGTRDLAATPPPKAVGASMESSLLATVEDNTLGIRRREAPAFFFLLDKARQIPVEQLAAAAEPGVQRLNLMSDPADYRGRPVTILGELRRLQEFPAGENDYGLKNLFEGWICTADSADRPFRVVCSRLAPELTSAAGAALPVPVQVTGYFFKREGYESPSGLQVAPTILANRIEPYAPLHALPPTEGLWPIVMGIVVGLGLILAATLVSFAWNAPLARPRFRRLPKFPPETTESLATVDLRSLRDQLRELEERDLYGAWRQPSVAVDAGHRAANGRVRDDSVPVELPTPPPPTRAPRSSFGESSELR